MHVKFLRYVKIVLYAVFFWAIVFGVAYTTYFSMGKVKADGDVEVEEYQASFRLVCYAVTKGDENCWNRVEFYWKTSWEPPVWLWKRRIVTPFLGAAPFFFLPLSVQTILLEPRYWITLSEEDRRQTVWHELGHATMKWGHSKNDLSLMTPVKMIDGNLINAFIIAYEENKK